MEPLYNNPSLQKLYQLVNAYSESPTEAKEHKISDLFREKCASFNKQDSEELRHFAASLQAEGCLPHLSQKVAQLADILSQYPEDSPSLLDLHPELHDEVIRHIGTLGQAGIYTTSRYFAEKMKEKLYQETRARFEASQIENSRWAIFTPQTLIEKLKFCGPQVRRLDFSLLMREKIPKSQIPSSKWEDFDFIISNNEKPTLKAEELKTILALCPHLESLTLYEHHKLKFGDVVAALRDSPARESLRQLNIVNCYMQPDVDAFKEVCPEAEMNLLGSPRLSDWARLGVRIQDVVSLPRDSFRFELFMNRDPYRIDFRLVSQLPHLRDETAQRLWLQSHKAGLLAQAGLNFLEFEALPDHQQEMLLQQAEQVTVELRAGRSLQDIIRVKRQADAPPEDEPKPKRSRSE